MVEVVKESSDALMRLGDVLALVPVSRSTWYAGVKVGIYPAQVDVGARIAMWRRSDIERVVARGVIAGSFRASRKPGGPGRPRKAVAA